MNSQPSHEMNNFEKANAAANEVVHSVLEIARRTNTPIIIYRNGQIERLSPDSFPQSTDATIETEHLKQTGE